MRSRWSGVRIAAFVGERIQGLPWAIVSNFDDGRAQT
jgi:hypothetical protein